MLNLEPIQKMLRQYSGISVHGITDSGWFLDHQQPYHLEGRINANLSPIEAVKKGIPYWHSQIPSRCRNQYANEPSKCFIGYKIYPTLSGEYTRYTGNFATENSVSYLCVGIGVIFFFISSLGLPAFSHYAEMSFFLSSEIFGRWQNVPLLISRFL